MKVKYLGTAAAEGWPAIFCKCQACKKARELGGKNIRTRSQVIIDDVLLMDLCPDNYAHVLKYNLELFKVNTLLVTHSHMDHFYFDDLIMRARPYAHGGEENKLTVYGNDKVEKMYKEGLVKDDSDNMGECVGFKKVTEFEPFKVEGYTITPLKAAHDPKENCYLYIIEANNGKRLLYGNDTAFFPEATWEYIKGLRFDIVSLDCTTIEFDGSSSHMGLNDNAKVKMRMNEIGCVHNGTQFIITHFSHNGRLMHHELEVRAKELGLIAAYDGFEIEI